MHRRHFAIAGISLIEMAVFLVVLGFIVIAASRIYTVQSSFEKEKETAAKLETIREAINSHRSQYKRIPCPASRTAPINSEDFGYEFNLRYNSSGWTNFSNAGTGVYDDGCPYDDGFDPPPMTTNDTVRIELNNPAADPSLQYLSPARIGAVPTRTLGLSDDYMFDAWGHRFVYAMVEFYSMPGVYDPENDPDNFYSNLFYGRPMGFTIKDVSEEMIEDSAVQWLVISPGLDGRGAYGKNGTLVAPCPTGVLATENCDDDEVFLSSVRKNYSNTDDRFTSTLIYGFY